MTTTDTACTCDATKPDHVHADTCPALVTCPECDGAGELSRCVYDGSHGCSHVNDPAWTCPTCGGCGAATAAEVAAFHAARCEHGVHEDDPAGCLPCRNAAYRCTCGPDHTGEAPDCRPDCPQHGERSVPDPWATAAGAWTDEPPF